jgi:hypothetical protein
MRSRVVPVMTGTTAGAATGHGSAGVRCGIGIAVAAESSPYEQAFPANHRIRVSPVEAVNAAGRRGRDDQVRSAAESRGRNPEAVQATTRADGS